MLVQKGAIAVVRPMTGRSTSISEVSQERVLLFWGGVSKSRKKQVWGSGSEVSSFLRRGRYGGSSTRGSVMTQI